eukprot:TRINITY_DN100455_c0_g1_i1.p1 TRINITY_DN100455_c0_g1~~TRINITY_DN100455_c0_g1_i1.p1  ORF type:complete len:532 (-),score=68.16 TRINITY_DN100455_c0_g1_i1:317-1912(-)
MFRVAAAVHIACLFWLAEAEPLLLTPLLQAGKIEEARKLSRVEVDGQYLGHSGYFSVPSSSGKNLNHMFVWFQPCQNGCDPVKAPFLQWVDGGPGVPDTFGAFANIGRWYVDANLTLQQRCFSWCKEQNCLFIDSPTMTGYSYQVSRTTGKFDLKTIEYTRTSEEATQQLLSVVLQFFQVWPEYSNAPYYVNGFSYGGHYVPWMTYNIARHNKDKSPKINIKGMSIGDPISDNKYQFPTYARTLYAMGLVMEDERDLLEDVFANATAWNDIDCYKAFMYWSSVWNDDGGSACDPHCPFLFKAFTGSTNTEHILLGAAPDELSTYWKQFLARHSEQFHFEGQPNVNTSMSEGGEVYLTMVRSGDYCESTAHLYTKLFLEEQLDVVVYSGNLDALLGPPTTAAALRAAWDVAEAKMEGGKEAKRAFYAAKKQIWSVSPDDTNPAGYSRCLERGEARFCYVIVRNAGHEVVPSQPRAMYDFQQRFIRRLPFDQTGHSASIPDCAQCGGMPPLAGSSLPACSPPRSFQEGGVSWV